MRKLIVYAALSSCLCGLVGCKSETYAGAMKDVIRDLQALNLAYASVKNAEQVDGAMGRVREITDRLKEDVSRATQLEPAEPKEKARTAKKYKEVMKAVLFKRAVEEGRIRGMEGGPKLIAAAGDLPPYLERFMRDEKGQLIKPPAGPGGMAPGGMGPPGGMAPPGGPGGPVVPPPGP
jgi:hypothetical protein